MEYEYESCSMNMSICHGVRVFVMGNEYESRVYLCQFGQNLVFGSEDKVRQVFSLHLFKIWS